MASVSNFTNRFTLSIPVHAVFKLSHISHSTRLHLRKVYASLALCTLMATAGSCVCLATSGLSVYGGLAAVSILGSLISVILLAVTTHSPETENKRFSILLGLSVFLGFALGPVLHLEVSTDPSIVVLALAGSTLLFAFFTLSALYVERRIYMLVGGILPILVIMFLLTMIDIVTDMDTHLGVLLYCAFVMIDTQLIIERAENGDKDYIWHCVGLFLDITEMFRKITSLLAFKTNNNEDVIEKCTP